MRLPKWLKKSEAAPFAAPPPAQEVQADRAAADVSEGYSADQPIRAKEEDRFNRWPFAKRIAETLAARRDPSSLVIAIYGQWGDGKTSTLGMMEQALVAAHRTDKRCSRGSLAARPG